MKKGDEVICQTFTYAATVNPIIYQQAIPIFIDSEEETWNMCPIYLEEAIKDRISKGKKPKAIIFVDVYGMPAKIQEIKEIANKYNILLIEDAAEALGSEYNGEKCGSFGDYSILSFNKNKIITTLGGGALVCKNQEEKNRALFLATQAKEDVCFYEHKEIGYNYRMNSLAAILGINQLRKIEEKIKERKNINFFYKEEFSGVKDIYLLSEKSKKHKTNNWLSCLIINKNIKFLNKSKIWNFFNNKKIEVRFLWNPMHMQPVFRKYPFYGENIAENLFKNGLCLPSGNNISRNDLKRISSSIKKLL